MKKVNVKLRKCIVCSSQKQKEELIRIVKNKDGDISIDNTHKMNGRGAYVCKEKSCIDKAVKNRLLNKHLKANISEEIYEELKMQV